MRTGGFNDVRTGVWTWSQMKNVTFRYSLTLLPDPRPEDTQKEINAFEPSTVFFKFET